MKNTCILINALGIVNSGGISVFEKFLKECRVENPYTFIIVANESVGINRLKSRYKEFNFLIIKNNSIYRVFYENVAFRRLVIKYKIQLIYNFSGLAHLEVFTNVVQLTKVHNLLFYSRRLDAVYYDNGKYLTWVKQVFLRRLYFKFMLKQSKYIEVQSSHVQGCLSDFINPNNKFFYEKSDIDICGNSFNPPRKYNFLNKVKFLYIVGPHFEFLHKNFIVFADAMSAFDRLNIDYEINITLTKKQLHDSKIWHPILDSKTNFLGYIDSQDEMSKLFCSNTILISTSIIETLGLHVIEGIKNGVITIAPNESYARAVYGDNMILYDTLNSNSLLNAIRVVLESDNAHSELILSLQDKLKEREVAKYNNILDIFKEVLNVQK